MAKRKPMPRGRMAEIFEEIGALAFDVIEDKLLEGASANEIARVLTDNGHSVSPTTVKARRKELRSANDSQ